jgi:hypothetical protein
MRRHQDCEVMIGRKLIGLFRVRIEIRNAAEAHPE